MKCSLSLSPSGDLLLSIPSPTGEAQTVLVPFSVEGLRVIRKVLLARESEPDQRLGHWSEPTQSMVEAFLRNERETKAKSFVDKYDIQLEI